MIRTPLLAAVLAAGLAVPVLAAGNAAAGPVFTQHQARQHLLHLGYTKVSRLQRDAQGNWAGVALKDGRTVQVAVGLKPGAAGTN